MKKFSSLIIFLMIFSTFTYSQYSSPYSSFLDVNQVNAMVFSDGNYFWDLQGSPKYEVPKNSSKNTLFALNIWLGAESTDCILHCSGNLYDAKSDFLPGPILDIATLDDSITANEYNKIWSLTSQEIEAFKMAFDNGEVNSGSYTIPDDILTWPGDHPALNEQLAPYVDVNADGTYDPYEGDYPKLKGNKMLWWVYNDNTYRPGAEGYELGAEFRVSFYAYYCDTQDDSVDVINYTTFMDVEVMNRSTSDYQAAVLSVFSDFDIGYAFDDYIGCNVELNSMYGYNGSIVDGSGQIYAYGGPTPVPPTQSITFLEGPLADENDSIDNDHDGVVDEPGEQCLFTGFVRFNNDNTYSGNPVYSADFLNYMNGYWLDVTQMVYGGLGHVSDSAASSVATRYLYPADSDPLGYGQDGIVMPEWSEITSASPPGDRRGLGNCGRFTFEAGEKANLCIALNFAQADAGDIWSSVEESFNSISNITSWYENGNFPTSHYLRHPQAQLKDIIVYPNPASNQIYIENIIPNSILKIYTLTGELLYFKEASTSKVQVDLSGYARGMYFIQVIDNETSSSKLIELL